MLKRIGIITSGVIACAILWTMVFVMASDTYVFGPLQTMHYELFVFGVTLVFMAVCILAYDFWRFRVNKQVPEAVEDKPEIKQQN
jgi:uncharacterized membrane protein YidH (DUF202 family)